MLPQHLRPVWTFFLASFAFTLLFEGQSPFFLYQNHMQHALVFARCPAALNHRRSPVTASLPSPPASPIYTREQLLSFPAAPLDPALVDVLRSAGIGYHLPRTRRRRGGRRKQRSITVVVGHGPRETPAPVPRRPHSLLPVPLQPSSTVTPSLRPSSDTNGFSVVSFNAQSVKSNDMASKRFEIATFVEDNAVDVMFVTETWFSAHGDEAKIAELAPSGYVAKSFPRPSGSSGGGIVVIYRTSLHDHLTFKTKFSFAHSSFELVQVSVTLQHKVLHFFCLYRPPPSRRNKLKDSMFTDQLPELLDYTNTLHGHICLTGDANIHFDCVNETLTKRTVDLLAQYNLEQVIDSSTHKKGHILDWVVIRPDDDVHTGSTVSDALESDHQCIFSHFNVTVAKPLPVYRTVRNVRAVDRSVFAGDLTAGLAASPSPSAEHADQYCASLRSVLDRHAPPTKRKVTERPSSPWFSLVSEELLVAKRERRQAERRWRRTGLTVFKDLYKKAKHHVSKIVQKAKMQFFNTKISSSTSSKELYQLTNKLLAKPKSAHLPTLYPTSDLPGLFSNFFVDKIEKLRSQLRSQTVTSPSPSHPFTSATFSTFQPVSESDVKKCILQSAPKTCDLDPIPTPLLIECLDSLLPSLTALFNSSLSSGVFPQTFKTAIVTPLLKKPSLDPNELKNYRPVSNLCFISKILEKLVLSQLSSYLTSNNLHNPLQSAYRPGHSTETALLKVVNDLLLSLDNGNVSLLALLDLSAAFNTIDHSILLHRLEHDFGVSGTALQWFSSYLTNRSQSVVVNGLLSDPSLISSGVPQGSVLGPVLFVIYTTPLSAVIQTHSVLHHSYADDTQLQKSAPPRYISDLLSAMQLCIGDIKSWMTTNMLKLNDEKTELMLVSSSRMSQLHSLPDSMTINNTTIPFSDSVKNLGVTFDCHLTMKNQVQNIIRSCNFELRRIASIRRFLSTEATLTLVSAFILSRLDYCNSLLIGSSDDLLDRLQRVQNSAARLILRLPKSSNITQHLVSLHWLPVKSRITYKVASLCYCCVNNTAPVYLSDLIQKKALPLYNTRSSSDPSLLSDRPACSKKTLGDRSFSYSASSVWKSIPLSIRSSPSPSSFKSALKTHLFCSAFQ